MKSIIWLNRPGQKPMASMQHQTFRQMLLELGYQISVQTWQDRALWRRQHTCDWLIWSFIPSQLEVWTSRMHASRQMVVLHELTASVSRFPEVDHWLVASESLRMYCLDAGIDSTKITVGTGFHTPGSSTTSTLRHKYHIDCHSPLIYIGGPMQTPQGNRMAIWALSILQYLHPHARMVLHGCGEATSSIELWMEGIVDGNVVFQEPADTPVHELVSQCDAVWLPRETDGVPDALLSGLCAGKPILASRQPSIMEWIQHEHNGILIENNQAPAWASAMHQLLLDETQCMKISANAAHTRIPKRFHLPQCLTPISPQFAASAA